MRVLCCLDGSNLEFISTALKTFVRSDTLTLAFIYVIDSAPHEDMGRQRSRFFRSPQIAPLRREQMQEAEQLASNDILAAATTLFPDSSPLVRQGRPEREIVNCAAEWTADLLILCPRSLPTSSPLLGPKSVGHVARFVLDHAPCAVLLARTPTSHQFPLDPHPPKPPHDEKRPRSGSLP
jgi:nucleotide-binding universal stress UspA family protein